MPAFRHLSACLDLANQLLPALVVQPDISADPRYRYMFSVEAVNELVKAGKPFRDAYREVGLAIEAGEDFARFQHQSAEALHHTHEGSLGNLCLEEIRAKLERAYGDLRF